jgi:hypothetical protein
VPCPSGRQAALTAASGRNAGASLRSRNTCRRIAGSQSTNRSVLEVTENPLQLCAMSKVEQVEAELRQLSQGELRQIREWLDDIIEDELEFTPEFEKSIQQAERDMAKGTSVRVREPEGS